MGASITVKRTTDSWQDLARAYTVLIDGKKVGKVRRGKELTTEVVPGEHEVQMKIDWTKSEKQTVQLSDGESAEFLCSPPGSTAEAKGAAAGAVLGKMDISVSSGSEAHLRRLKSGERGNHSRPMAA